MVWEDRMNGPKPVSQVLFGDLQRLRYVNRYSGQPVVRYENVAEHSFWTAIIAVTIATEMELSRGDIRECALRGLLHDIEESMTGDLVRDLKYYDQETRDAIGRVEKQFAEGIFRRIGGRAGDLFAKTWTNAKNPVNPSGDVVALADLLCVLSYIQQERDHGNVSLTLGRIENDCRKLIVDKFGNSWLSSIVAEVLFDNQKREEL